MWAGKSGYSTMYTWQIQRNSCSKQIILPQALLISYWFKANLFHLFSVALQPLLHWWFTIMSFPSSKPILSPGFVLMCWRGVIFSQAVTWCQCKRSLRAVGFWYNMLQTHSSQPVMNDDNPVDLKTYSVTSEHLNGYENKNSFLIDVKLTLTTFDRKHDAIKQ